MLSVVINFFNNRREAPNSLHALTRGYQRLSADFAYEVVVLDHGSTEPLDAASVAAFGPEFRYRYVETAEVSPVRAINAACRAAAGDRLMVVIDGAHILSPGVLRLSEQAFRLFPRPFVATVPLHLGPKVQSQSVSEGYDQRAEDGLLQKLAWKDDGYRLFAGAGSFADGSFGWFGSAFESNCFALRKSDFALLGGYDERFQSRGGGLVNLEFFQRAVARSELDYVMLLGEGTFHQFHGGVATNASAKRDPWQEFHAEFVRLTGRSFGRMLRRPFYLGSVPDHAMTAHRFSASHGLEFWQKV
ncbi:MAG TPA: glycosyltransferase [Rudaea sp.]|nr:glycosyltransferase [Rudaea sp.]